MKLLKSLYNWVLHWAHTPYGTPALFGIAFAESSFFPVPPDVLQIALSISRPKRSFFYASVSSVASVLGGMAGYAIGVYLMSLVGWPILHFYGLQAQYEHIQILFQKYDAWAIAIAGFTPIPYKLFTIASGAFSIHFGIFVIASLLSRSARFFLVGLLIYFFGESIRGFIDRYFNLLTLLFFVLLILGFYLVGVLFR
ncbi:MAG: YqaA family protein [Deltaproteobacteria bacterium]